MTRHAFAAFAVLLALAFYPTALLAQDEAVAETIVPQDTGLSSAREAYVIDFDTGTVLMDKNGDSRMPTSSMSKTMTIYMAFDAIKNGKLTLDTKLPVSEKAWRMQGSKMFVELGSAIAVEDLIRGIIIQSGNDATVVLAEGIAGTEENFADLMNAKAKEIGMLNSNFVNASGWPDPDHYSTPHDLAILAVRTIRDFPDLYKYYAEKEFTWHNIHQMNRNPLLFRDLGADGLKTGHAEEAGAGYGLIGSAVRDGRRVIVVLNGLPDEKSRAQEAARLIEWGLRSFENVKLFAAGDVVEQASVAMGQATQVPLVTDQDIVVTMPGAVKNDLKVTAVYNGPLVAPVSKGDQVGTLKIDIPRVGAVEHPLYAGADVAELGFFAATMTKAKMLLGAKMSETQEATQ
ncbi:MAG: D-alanyl-D-alanine carboxypeptidase family protein [Micavibrio sp.]